MADRRLVVNGDDFGLTPGVNAGIADAHRAGILTSASVLANAPATDDAVRIARAMPSLGIGFHLALVDADAVLPAELVPTLAPRGHFRPTWRAFIADAVRGRIASVEIERELEAQIERLLRTGLRLTHLDSHKHVHASPPVFDIVARLACRFGIGTVRVPYERRSVALVARYCARPGARRQAIENVALAAWTWRDRRILARRGLAPAPCFLGRVLTGLLTTADVGALLKTVDEGVSELMTHPGYPDEALARIATRLRHQRAAEVAMLTDPRIIDAVRRERITLVRHGTSAIAQKPVVGDFDAQTRRASARDSGGGRSVDAIAAKPPIAVRRAGR